MRKPKTAMKISGAFRKSVRHIPAEIKRKLTQVIETLARDPHTQELQMEKLKVPSDQVYSVRLSHKSRLIFRRLSCGTIELLCAANHEIAYRPY